MRGLNIPQQMATMDPKNLLGCQILSTISIITIQPQHTQGYLDGGYRLWDLSTIKVEQVFLYVSWYILNGWSTITNVYPTLSNLIMQLISRNTSEETLPITSEQSQNLRIIPCNLPSKSIQDRLQFTPGNLKLHVLLSAFRCVLGKEGQAQDFREMR